MSHLSPIYAPWNGNAEAMAADIGEKPVTVRQWRNRGNIPPRYWQAIIAAASRKGAELELATFLPASAPPPARPVAPLPEAARA